MVIVTASYNNKNWYIRNLDSVFNQKYQNYSLIYIDDCSPDNTGGLVKEYIEQKGQSNRVTLIQNTVRRRALTNIYNAIHMCNDRAIIVVLDGDDWFAHENVLSYLNKIYADDSVWLTYGQFKWWPSGQKGFVCPVPQDIIQRNAIRKWAPTPSHLRTFYAGLFKKIRKEDLFYEGDFLAVTYDLAIMFPMIEMAGYHMRFIPEILMTYNFANPINDQKVAVNLQAKMDHYLRAQPRYMPLDHLF
jgi:glycosyltransferase involved in cell wall biosynthesis